ncbi:hypothetical protein [Actinoplanes solisilvae]|uniref:hypothetical protein n=1 Tax=Actinoplanes solisilvae TaxID=2486853 RepID=UPI000FD80727|nr:hypothetical protein [Actinoplanes solisilvae]
MRRLTLILTSVTLAALAGCGGAGDAEDAETAAATPGVTQDTGQDSAQLKAENMTADCMKRKGFRYVPHTLDFGDDNGQAKFAGMSSIVEPADQVRAFRAKYGFGGFSQIVYPNDPAVKQPEVDPAKNPNNAIRDALDPAQQKAYDAALHGAGGKGAKAGPPKGDPGCANEAAAKYYGSGPSKDEQAAAAREFGKFKNDPAVVAAVGKYASCLKEKGYPVNAPQPGMIEQSMFSDAITKFSNAGQVDVATAKQALGIEIKAALDDLECRTDYAVLARAKGIAVVQGGGVG